MSDTPTGVSLSDLALLIEDAASWGSHEASHFYGRRNSRRTQRKRVIARYAKITMMSLSHAEHDLEGRGLFALFPE